MSKLGRTTLAIDTGLLKQFDAWMQANGYTNRSEAVRDLIRARLAEQQWADDDATVVAVLSVVYDHEQRELAQELTRIQHADHHAILCSQHVHLDQHNCLEAIILRGKTSQLRRVAGAIVATRGVIAGKVSILSAD
jgi:CopG family nickel-responsive transcriptional regulator